MSAVARFAHVAAVTARRAAGGVRAFARRLLAAVSQAYVRLRSATLALHLSLVTYAVMIAAIALVGALQALFLRQFLLAETARSLHQELMDVPAQAWIWLANESSGAEASGPPFRLGPLPFLAARGSLAYVDPSGQVHPIYAPHGLPVLSRETYEAMLNFGVPASAYQLASTSHGRDLVVTALIGPPDRPLGLAQVSVPTSEIDAMVARQMLLYGVVAFAVLVAALAAYRALIRRALVPLHRVVEHAQRIDAGNLDERFEVRPGMQAEVRSLAASFNGMLDRLGSAFWAERDAKERMRQFVADASHELRTPLTALSGYLEVLQKGGDFTDEEWRDALQQMHGEARRLAGLVEQMLRLARAEDVRASWAGDKRERVRLGTLVMSLDALWRGLCGSRELTYRIEGDPAVFADPDALKQVLFNLVQNAVQHTPEEGGEIVISVWTDGCEAKLAVADNGTGIPKVHQPHVFERFYRVDEARSRAKGGAGLGLAICKAIVEAHGGRIACESEPGEGAAFTVTLPVAGTDGDGA
ncbi:HAMP domain-containing protein [Alicyclobacillus mali]|uniref:histidine kinase n=1 Tax=Alicyclobacillus mali (ex Roth et al. 2021) TaxID=1123961 RepID=A0ABS0F0E3_9BACL|nr:HAMP domain-containing sensor histidine kinase [Alicyclobacillus mali (ex Roth et al. 2021)]MBF8376748.1 HAMP domain-containing protein [Alicyclobacillus mali (ex Roth et al. 2021)]